MNEGRRTITEPAADIGLNSNGVLAVRFEKDGSVVIESNANLLKIGAHLCIAVVHGIQDDKVVWVCNQREFAVVLSLWGLIHLRSCASGQDEGDQN
ncbi:hypothetical protein [Variovorax paradoxus]|uniref:hypothetical protein n=1 Tax=Variovorax paradoxus TaxID=34073 RepID=UPI003ED0B44D